MTSPRLLVGLITALLFALGGSALASAQTTPPGPPSHRSWGHGSSDGELALMIRAAELTPEQQGKVRDVLSAHRTSTRSLVDQLRQAQQELGAKLLSPGAVQATDLQPHLQRIGQLRDQLAQDSAQAALAVRAVLTPEQLAKVAQTRDRLRQLREEMRQLMEPARP
jgi:Spy/CpxP family protein refolding chaperone